MYRYKTRGTCSSAIDIDVEDGIVKSVAFTGGCRGNLQAVCRLVTGQRVEDVIEKLEGIPCQGATSCPDQLARALKQMRAEGKT